MPDATELERERAHLRHLLTRRETLRGERQRARYVVDGHVTKVLDSAEMLGPADKPVAFGRICEEDGQQMYVGPATLRDDGGQILTVNWRADAARRYFEASHHDPQHLSSRRSYTFDEDLILSDFDEVVFSQLAAAVAALPHDDSSPPVDDALLADLRRTRSGELKEIVRTIQAAQFRIISAPLDQVLVVQGGPGTGKSAVALHRVSWLLHHHRDRLAANDVLVVSPNAAFARYVGALLPDLGEHDVRQITLSQLYPATASAEGKDTADVTRLKGDGRMAQLLRAAVDQAPVRPADGDEVTVAVQERAVRLAAEQVSQAVAHVAADTNPYLVRRRTLRERLLTMIEDQDRWLPQRLAREAANALTTRLWPRLTAEELVTRALTDTVGTEPGQRLFTAQEREALGAATVTGTADDAALLDEASALLEGGPERYGLIVVDEAQDLSTMQLRAIARRSRSGALTLVGDLAQATGPSAHDDWAQVLAHLPRTLPSQVAVLEHGYRVPQQVVALAAPLVASLDGVSTPLAVSRSPQPPGFHPRRPEHIATQVATLARQRVGEGRYVGVIVPESLHGDITAGLDAAELNWAALNADPQGASVIVAAPHAVKGLEFEATIVVEPAAILASDPRGDRLLYVALTRCTAQLDLVYHDARVPMLDLPSAEWPAGDSAAASPEPPDVAGDPLVEQVAGELAAHCRDLFDELSSAAVRADAVRRAVAALAGAPSDAVADRPDVHHISPEVDPAGTTAAERAMLRWRRSLIDLSLRNPLLNLPARGAGFTLALPAATLARLDDLIHDGVSLELAPSPPRDDNEPGASTTVNAAAQLETGQLMCGVTPERFHAKVRQLQRDSLTVRQETGGNYLYLTLGAMVHPKASGERARAPLFLLPVSLDGGLSGEPYHISADGQDVAIPNYALVEWLRVTHGLRIDALENPLLDASGIAIPQVLNSIGVALQRHGLPYQVEASASLHPLRFSTVGLWRDLTHHTARLLTNPVVQQLADPVAARTTPDPTIGDVSVDETDLLLPLPADGSQLTAVAAAVAGTSFVLEGPPGTGKSQTIANIIAAALGAGQTVLVVAEKEAALDVLGQRLDDVGLAPFTLGIYGARRSGKAIRDDLMNAMSQASGTLTVDFDEQLANLRAASSYARQYADTLRTPVADGLWHAWTTVLDSQEPTRSLHPNWAGWVRTFDPARHAAAIDQLTHAAEAVRRGVPAQLIARLTAARDSLFADRPGDVTALRTVLRSRRDAMSPRQLFGEFSDLILASTPCVLASPANVATHLGSCPAQFDLVVFDEASQVRVAEAIGAIGRGRTAVIVGDTRQMPPTNLIKTKRTPLDDDLPHDLYDVLRGALDAGLPRHRLKWHYRSRYESLISFSNRHYYDGQLATLPSPTPDPGSISWRRVKGEYGRGGSRDNPREAFEIVAEIERRLSDPTTAGDSIGVVTLNLEQRDLILNLLEENPHPEVIRRLRGPDSLFVKNLETVQGDEREVILFSLGYSADSRTGRVPMTFGPLNWVGGERRWNVAITRARKQVMLFASFDPSALTPEPTMALGVHHLKEYCALAAGAAHAAAGTPEGTDDDPDPVLASVAEAIRARGYDVTTRLGTSDFRVDLAVKRPDAPTWQVAVVADGPWWVARNTVADRELMPGLLRAKLGWQSVERFWLAEWINDRNLFLNRIDAALGGPTDQAGRSWEERDRYASRDTPRWPPGPARPVTVEDLLDQEGPLPLARLRALAGQRLGLTGEEVEAAVDRDRIRHHPGAKAFLWPRNLDPDSWQGFRTDQNRDRAVEDVSPEELSNMIVHVLGSADSRVRVEQLADRLVAEMGFAARSPAGDLAIRHALRLAQRRRQVQGASAGWGRA